MNFRRGMRKSERGVCFATIAVDLLMGSSPLSGTANECVSLRGVRQLAPFVSLHSRDELISANPVWLEYRCLALANVEPILSESIEDVRSVGDDDDIGWPVAPLL